MNIQHMIIDNETATARIDWANRPSSQDAMEILQGFEFAGFYTDEDSDPTGNAREITINAETRAELEEIANPYIVAVQVSSDLEMTIEELEASFRLGGDLGVTKTENKALHIYFLGYYNE